MGPVHQSPCHFVGPGEPDARERLLHGYHTEGLDIASHEVLEKLGVDAGLEPSAVRGMLEGTEFTENVRADERSAWKRGVRGVPTLVPDGGPPASVIQDPGVLDRLLTPGPMPGATAAGPRRGSALTDPESHAQDGPDPPALPQLAPYRADVGADRPARLRAEPLPCGMPRGRSSATNSLWVSSIARP